MVHDVFGAPPGGHISLLFVIAASFAAGWLALRFMGGGNLRGTVVEAGVVFLVAILLEGIYFTWVL